MRIDLTGQVRIEDGDRVLDETRLAGRQGRVVFACLALRARPVHRDVLADSLWPHGLPPTWERTLAGVVSRLRSAMGEAGFDQLTIANAFGCYELQRPGVPVDVEIAATEVIEAQRALDRNDLSAAALCATTAVDIARRPLLAGEDAGWLDTARGELRSICIRGLEVRAAATLGVPAAIDDAREALDLQPFRGSAHVLLMRAHSAAGHVAEALFAYERYRELLGAELGLDPAPEAQALHLELLAADEEASRRGRAAERARDRRRRAPGGIERAIARERTSFVGRSNEIDEVTEILQSSRLVTLVGPGGIGKTRIAVRTAANLTGEVPDGIFFCDLSSLRDPAGVARTIGEATGTIDPLAEAGGAEVGAIERHVASAIDDSGLVIVLDNCEHVLETCSRICRELLDACANLTVLATSREPLRVTGEDVYVVQPLTSRTDDATSEATQLFVDRSRAVRAGFEPSSDDIASIRRICSLLDGIPLALELAAARMNVLSPSQIADRLDDALGFLASRVRGVPERHRTMEAAIDWSYQLLDPQEAVLFRRLAAFVGGFSLEGAERVCGTDPREVADVLGSLSGLVDKSMVVVETDGSGTRYRLLEPLRQFAESKLREAGEEDDARRAHRGYALELTAGVSWGLQVDRARLDSVIPELDNVAAALRWSIDHDEAPAAMQLAVNAYGVWRYIGRPMDARNGLSSALATTDGRPSILRAACLGFLGESHLHGGDVDAAYRAYEEAIEIFRAREFAPGLGWSLIALADAQRARRDVEAMRLTCLESIDVFRSIGDDNGLAWALANYGGLLFGTAILDESRRFAEVCVALGSAAPIETVLRMEGLLGVLAAMDGDASGGRERYEIALRALEKASRFELHWLLMTVGALEIGDAATHASGRERLRLALEIVRGSAVIRPVPWILELAAQVATDDGRMNDAARLFGVVRSFLERSGDSTPWDPFRQALRCARTTCEETLCEDFASTLADGASMDVLAAVDLGLAVLGCDV